MPERDIESLVVMGWGLEAARKFFRRRRRRPPKWVFGNFGFPLFSDTMRDLDAILPGNYS